MFDSIAKSISICSLSVGNEGSTNRNRIGAIGAKSLSNMLERNQLISILDLTNLNIGVEYLQIMAEGFSKSNSLVYLKLSRNEINVDACQHLSSALLKNTIEGLDLSSNPLGDAGVRQLCHLVSHGNHLLTRIDISNCSFTNQVGNNLFSTIVGKATNLIRLNISGNLFG